MKSDRKYTLGIIGFGHMGVAIARGAVNKEYLERYQIAVYDKSEHAARDCKLESFDQMSSAKELADNSHIVLIAVTPQQAPNVFRELQGADIEVILSIVTGMSIKHLQEELHGVPVIRAMPNTPLQINEGATALCMSDNCQADDYDFVFQLFQSMGVTRTIPEDKMDDIVAVHGSTPAYVYYLVWCILKDAEARGVDEADARALLVQTVIGSGKLLQKNADKPLSEFIDEVCSKGGTTIEAIQELHAQNMEKIIHNADEKCIARAKEIGH